MVLMVLSGFKAQKIVAELAYVHQPGDSVYVSLQASLIAVIGHGYMP
jgi:hypothetical protein